MSSKTNVYSYRLMTGVSMSHNSIFTVAHEFSHNDK